MRKPAYHRDPVLAGLTLAGVLSCVWALIGPAAVQMSWLVQVGLDIAFVWGAWRVAAAAGCGPARRFWRGLSVAWALVAIGDAIQSVIALVDRAQVPDNSLVQAVFIAAGTACGVAVMLTHPLRMSRRERLRLWLDAATVLVAVAVFAWTAIAGQGGTSVALTGLIGAGLLLVSSFGLVKLLLSGTAPFTRLAAVVGGLGTVFTAVYIALSPMIAHTSHPGLVTAARLLPCIPLATTPRLQELQMRGRPEILARRWRPYSRLPYLAVAATQGLLAYLFLVSGTRPRIWGALAGTVLITALVLVRQLVAFHDNARLLERLGRQEERFRSLVQHASDLTVVLDADGTVRYVSPALTTILGSTPAEATGTAIADWIHPDDRTAGSALLTQLHAAQSGTVTAQLRAPRRDGSWRWLEVIGTNLLDTPSVCGLVLNARDVTETRQLHDRLQHEATHDPLTGLANRALFEERLRRRCASPGTAGLEPALLTVIAIDLDKFKEVNDTLGHHVGDGLLIAVADRLRHCLRPEDTVARLGGDEFAVLLAHPLGHPLGHPQHGGAQDVADRIRAAFAEPAVVDGHLVPIRASLGVAVGAPEDPAVLLRQADAAMYAAKRVRADEARLAR